jgi:hypothetical protein
MIRSKHVIHVEYGCGDASGKGFGSTITLNGVILWRAGQWQPSYEEESSNLRELENIVRADNFVTGSAFFKGNSQSESLFELVLRLRLLEMHTGWKLHVVHIAGTRLIRQASLGRIVSRRYAVRCDGRRVDFVIRSFALKCARTITTFKNLD